MKVNEWHNYRAVSPLKPGGTFEQRCSKGVRPIPRLIISRRSGKATANFQLSYLFKDSVDRRTPTYPKGIR